MRKKIKFSTVPYEVGLKARLADPSYAVGFLKSCIEESAGDVPEAVLSGLRSVAEVHGMTGLSKKTGITRQSLYQMLSKNGNPSIRAFMAIMSHLGIRLSFEPEKPRRKRAG